MDLDSIKYNGEARTGDWPGWGGMRQKRGEVDQCGGRKSKFLSYEKLPPKMITICSLIRYNT